MAHLLPVTDEQRSAIFSIVERDAAEFFLGGLATSIEMDLSYLELMVHNDVISTGHQDIAHGLPKSPRQVLTGGNAVFLSGAREVGIELAIYLAAILEADRNKCLYIPHAYARPAEIVSLQGDFDGRVIAIDERVYIRCSGPSVSPELIRRALASMICAYSVGWLLDREFPRGRPCLAVVPLFDGEGWAIMGKASLRIKPGFVERN